MLKMKIRTPKILPYFPTASEMFPLKMMREWYHLTSHKTIVATEILTHIHLRK